MQKVWAPQHCTIWGREILSSKAGLVPCSVKCPREVGLGHFYHRSCTLHHLHQSQNVLYHQVEFFRFLNVELSSGDVSWHFWPWKFFHVSARSWQLWDEVCCGVRREETSISAPDCCSCSEYSKWFTQLVNSIYLLELNWNLQPCLWQ